MKKFITAIIALALISLGAFGSSAVAHPDTYTVSVGGSTAAGTHPFFAIADAPIAFSVSNGLIVTDMDCDEVNLEGEIESGTGVDPIGIVKAVTRVNTPETFDHSQWKGCHGPGGLDMTVVPLNDWEIHATGPVASGSSDVVTGYISGPNDGPLEAHVYATSFPGVCNFEVHGYADGSFNEATQKLAVNETGFSGDLEIANTTANCGFLVNNTNEANFVGTFTVGEDHASNSKSGITEFLPINLISSP